MSDDVPVPVFKELEGDVAILYQKGVFKQTTVYTRHDGELFAKASGGFVRLYFNGATSKSDVRLEHLATDEDLFRDGIGRLYIRDGKKRTSIDKGKFLVIEDGTK